MGGRRFALFALSLPWTTHTHTCTKTTPEPATNTRFCVWETKKEIPSCTRLYNNQAFPLILPNELTLGGGS